MNASDNNGIGSKPSETRIGFQSEFLQPEWTLIARLSVGVLGVTALLTSSRVPNRFKSGLRYFGAASLIRALTNLNVTDLVGWVANPVLRINRTIHIRASVDDVYDFLKDFSNYPKFMSYIQDIEINDRGGLFWKAAGPGGLRVHWNTSVGQLQHNQAISWKSGRGSILRNAGQFILQEDSEGGTLLRAQLSYAPAAGILGYAVVQILGLDPRKTMADDLSKLKALIEQSSSRHFDQEDFKRA